MDRHVVARVEEIPKGHRRAVKVRGREIAVFHTEAGFFAILNRCPHEAAPLVDGYLVGLPRSSGVGQFELTRPGEFVRCPWHGWEFDLATGQSWCDPKRTFVKSYAVSVEAGETVCKGPYVAETFAVGIEGDYVVLEA